MEGGKGVIAAAKGLSHQKKKWLRSEENKGGKRKNIQREKLCHAGFADLRWRQMDAVGFHVNQQGDIPRDLAFSLLGNTKQCFFFLILHKQEMSIKKEDACAHSLKSQTTQRKITVEDELTVAPQCHFVPQHTLSWLIVLTINFTASLCSLSSWHQEVWIWRSQLVVMLAVRLRGLSRTSNVFYCCLLYGLAMNARIQGLAGKHWSVSTWLKSFTFRGQWFRLTKTKKVLKKKGLYINQ